MFPVAATDQNGRTTSLTAALINPKSTPITTPTGDPTPRSTPDRLSGSSSTAGRAADGECVSMPNPVNVKVGDGREISAGRARLMSVDVGGRIDLLTAPERHACRERWRDGCLGPR